MTDAGGGQYFFAPSQLSSRERRARFAVTAFGAADDRRAGIVNWEMGVAGNLATRTLLSPTSFNCNYALLPSNLFDFVSAHSQTVPAIRLAQLPPAFTSDKPYATEYGVALALLPPDEEDKNEAFRELSQDTLNRNLLLNVEYRVSGFPHATLADESTNQDIVKGLVGDGLLLVEKRRERKLLKLVSEAGWF